MIPGIDLLGMAFSLLDTESAMYFQFDSEKVLDDGTRVSLFKEPIKLDCCMFQPVDRSRYNELGLSFQRSYWDFWTQTAIAGVDRGYDGDVIEWRGRRLQVTSETPWFDMDGWNYGLLIDIGKATGQLTEPCMNG